MAPFVQKEREHFGKVIFGFTVPMMVAMMISIVYNLVDTFYIGLFFIQGKKEERLWKQLIKHMPAMY